MHSNKIESAAKFTAIATFLFIYNANKPNKTKLASKTELTIVMLIIISWSETLLLMSQEYVQTEREESKPISISTYQTI
jgi:hypothetical protein